MGIRLKITCLFLILSLGSIGLLGFASYSVIRQQLVENKLQEFEALVTAQKHNIMHIVTVWKDRVALLASRTRLRIALHEHLAKSDKHLVPEIERIVSDAYRTMRFAKKIFVCDLAGNKVIEIGLDQMDVPACGARKRLSRESETIDSFWVDPTSRRLMVMVTGDFLRDGRMFATAQVSFDAQELAEFVGSNINLGRTGEILVAESTPDGGARYLTPLRFEYNQDLAFTVAPKKINVPMIAALSGREVRFTDNDTVDYRGAQVYAVTRYLTPYQWGIVAKIDRSEVHEAINDLAWLIFYVAAGLSVLVVFASGYFGQLISWPLLHLNDIAKAVANGDLSQRATVNSSDEIGVLAQSFNQMTAAVMNHNAELEDSRERTQAVIETTVDGIITIDEAGTIQTFNNACETLFGYRAEEAIGQNVNILMPEPHHSAHNEYLEAYRRTGRARIIGIGRELTGRRKDGSVFEMALAVSAVRLKDRRLFSGIIRDISSRKAVERELTRVVEQLRETNSDLELFAYAASHDLKSPLRAIGSLISFLEEDLSGSLDEKSRERMSLIRNRLARMGTLVDDLLNYAELSHKVVSNETIDAAKLVHETCQLLYVPEATKVEICAGLNALYIPSVPLSQIFQNLIGNAIKHHDKEGGVIVVDGIANEEYFEFSVTDDGPGIAQEHQERIFEMFQTLKPREEVEGSGLGLSMVRKILHRFGGSIRVTSKIGVGTTFIFTWPRRVPVDQPLSEQLMGVAAA